MAENGEFLEREGATLSKIPVNRTVGILRAKKQSGSTQRGLHVGTGFKDFQQIPWGRGFILLGLFSI